MTTENEKWNLLQEGVNLILIEWTALRMAIEHEWGGAQSQAKAQELTEDLIYWFRLHKNQPDVMKLEEQLFAALLEDFNTQVEDGSLSQVAQTMIDLYHECRTGQINILQRLRLTAHASFPQQKQKERSSTSSEDDDGDEEEEEEEDELMQDAHPKSRVNEVDEDGFTIVRHRR